MKNIFDTIAAILVVLIVLAIIGLIVEYNLIDEKSKTDYSALVPVEKHESEQEKTSSYMDALEKYTKANVKP